MSAAAAIGAFSHSNAYSARVNAVLLSPVHGQLDPAALAEWMLEDRLPARLQLQMHKQIWGADTRGV
jgi:hypothetical protein